MESTLSIKGQATIPKPIRDHLHLAPGDRIKFFVHPDGTVVILPKIPTSALKGMIKSRVRHVASSTMKAASAAGAASRFRPAKRR